MAKTRYMQALVRTDDGIWAIAVTADTPLTEEGWISDPQAAFEDGSIVVAVEQGVMPPGDYQEIPNPFEVAEARSKVGGNGGHVGPKDFHSDGPRHGVYRVRYIEGGISLQKMPTFGQLIL